MLGPDHPLSLAAMHNLAGDLDSLGKLAESQTLYEDVVVAVKWVLGPDHPQTLMATNNLAWTYCSRGQFSKARSSYERALEVSRRVLGPEHPVTVTIANNLAKTLELQQKRNSREPTPEEADGGNSAIDGVEVPKRSR